MSTKQDLCRGDAVEEERPEIEAFPEEDGMMGWRRSRYGGCRPMASGDFSAGISGFGGACGQPRAPWRADGESWRQPPYCRLSGFSCGYGRLPRR